MNHNNSLDELKDTRAEHREQKRRPRMRVHGRGLKKTTTRSILHVAKIEHKKK